MFRSLFCAVVIVIGCLFAFSASAQGQKGLTKTREDIQQERMRQLVIAYDLTEQGRQQNAPEYLITAAGMLRQLSSLKDLKQILPVDAKVEITGDNMKEQKGKELAPLSLAKEAEDLFKEASDMGASLEVNVDKLIKLAKERADDVARKRPEEERDLVGGPRLINRKIGAGQVHSVRVTVKGNKKLSNATNFGFCASIPMHLSVVHDGPDSVLVNGTTMHYQHMWRPHMNVVLVIRVQNKAKVAGDYRMFIQ